MQARWTMGTGIALSAALFGGLGLGPGAAGAVSPAQGSSGPDLFVTGTVSGTVTVIDASTDASLATISTGVGSEPGAVIVGPYGKRAWVALENANEVVALNAQTDTLEQSIAVAFPVAMAVSPDGTRLYVVNAASSTLSVISLAGQGSVVATIPVGQQPSGIVISPDGKKAWVTNDTTVGAVTPVDLTTLQSEPAIPVGQGPLSEAITPNGGTLLVATQHQTLGHAGLTFISTASGAVVKTIALGADLAGDIAVAPTSSTAYVTCSQEGGLVSVIDIGTQSDIADVAVPNGPTGEALSADGKTLWITQQASNTIVPFSTGTRTLGTPLAVGNGPQAAALTPDQAPTAAFTATAAPAGQPSQFDASASSAPFSTIATYAWSFGDGDQVQSTSPTITHSYAAVGGYTVSVTVTDAAGTSRYRNYTGRQLLRNGGPTAVATLAISVP